jgi:hypothetical protein
VAENEEWDACVSLTDALDKRRYVAYVLVERTHKSALPVRQAVPSQVHGVHRIASSDQSLRYVLVTATMLSVAVDDRNGSLRGSFC